VQLLISIAPSYPRGPLNIANCCKTLTLLCQDIRDKKYEVDAEQILQSASSSATATMGCVKSAKIDLDSVK
jgi:hypothetical protein